MNNPELPLDPNLQTSNLLITFLKYASIVMQDTKGLCVDADGRPWSLASALGRRLLHFLCFSSDEHRLNSARLCLIILTCIAEVGLGTSPCRH